MPKYSIGIDYGEQSGSAVIMDIESGKILAKFERKYTHRIMNSIFSDEYHLDEKWALQHAADYIEVLAITIPAVIKEANVNSDDIIGLGINFASSTILAIDKNDQPLCYDEKYKHNPHAYVKLWNHQAAQYEADRLNKKAKEMGENFFLKYGGKVSAEWMLPKIMQILDEAPEIYNKADRFIEATDWVTLVLTGNEKRNICTSGYKGMWNRKEGYPNKEFFETLNPMLKNVQDKLSNKVYPLGTSAGKLTKEMAEIVQLTPNVAVAVGNVDNYVDLPAVGITEPGKMLMIIGKSTYSLLLGYEKKIISGSCKVVEDGIIPGLLSYEVRQLFIDNALEWCVKKCVPDYAKEHAASQKLDIHKYLNREANKLKPGESGLLAVGWLNENSFNLIEEDLSGILFGITLDTKAFEIYRALIESTAFEQRMIIENFEKAGIIVNELYVCGEISRKNEMQMQIYSDVTNRTIKAIYGEETSAIGAAMFGAVAAGKSIGGYESIHEASKKMSNIEFEKYVPNLQNVSIYNKLYNQYKKLHIHFGSGKNDILKLLKTIRNKQL